MSAINQSTPVDQVGITPVSARRITAEDIYQGSDEFYDRMIDMQEKILKIRYSHLSEGSGSRGVVDYESMQEDPAFERLQKTKEARTVFLAQQMAEDSAGTGATAETSDAAQTFLDYMAKTPEERYYDAILKEKGLTPEQLAALPPEERAKIEREIQAEIERRIKLEAATNETKRTESA